MTVIILSLALWMGLPLAFLIWKTTEKRTAKMEAVIEQQNRKISKLEKKLTKDEE